MEKLQTPHETTNEDQNQPESAMPPSPVATASIKENRGADTSASQRNQAAAQDEHDCLNRRVQSAPARVPLPQAGKPPAVEENPLRMGAAKSGEAPDGAKTSDRKRPGRPRGKTAPYLRLVEREGRNPQWTIFHGADVQIPTGTSDLAEAQKHFARYLAALGGKDPTREVEVSEMPVAEIVGERWKLFPEPLSTIRGQRLRELDDTLLVFWKDMVITQITPASCKAYAKTRKATGRNELKRLKTIVSWYRRRHAIGFQPAWWLPKKPPARYRWLTRSEVARLICAARGRTWDAESGDWKRKPDGKLEIRPHALQKSVRALVRVILIGVFTGTRADAILRARWSESALDPYILLDEGEERFHRKGDAEPCTNKRRPVARIPAELLKLLRLWHKADGLRRCDHVVTRFEVEWPKGKPTFVATRTPFGEYVGKRPPAGGVSKKNSAANEAGEVFRALRKYAGLPGITMHTLRHTCATWLLETADIEDVAQYLGVSVRELEETYGQYDPLFTLPAVEALDEWDRPGRPEPTGRGALPAPESTPRRA